MISRLGGSNMPGRSGGPVKTKGGYPMSKYKYRKENQVFWSAFDRETGDFICKVWSVKRSGRYKWRAGKDGVVARGDKRDQAVDQYLINKEWAEKFPAFFAK